MSFRQTTPIIFVIAFLILIHPYAKSADITGPDLWEKVIKYHDPDGKWATFKGKVHIVTTFRKDQLAGQIITLDNNAGRYQARDLTDQGATIGVKNGKAFASFKNPPQDEEQRLQQMLDRAVGMRQHHSGHIGMPMQMKVAGLVASDKVDMVNFKGRNCYAITLSGGTNEGPYSYWKGTWTLYVDPESFAMCGARSENEDFPSRYFECLGEIEVNGIKLQRVKNSYLSEDNSHVFTDVFAPAD